MPDKDATGADERATLADINDALRIALADNIEGMERERIEDLAFLYAASRREVERLSAAHVESERQLAAKHDDIGGLMDENAALRAVLRELLGALDESADASEHADDVRAMLRYAEAEKAARAALSAQGQQEPTGKTSGG